MHNSYPLALKEAALHVINNQLDAGMHYELVIQHIEDAKGENDRARQLAADALRTIAKTLADPSKPITPVELGGALIVLTAALVLHHSEISLKPTDHHQPPSTN